MTARFILSRGKAHRGVQESWCTHVAHTQAFSSWQATSEVLVLTNLGSPTPDHGMERTAQAGSIP